MATEIIVNGTTFTFGPDIGNREQQYYEFLSCINAIAGAIPTGGIPGNTFGENSVEINPGTNGTVSSGTNNVVLGDVKSVFNLSNMQDSFIAGLTGTNVFGASGSGMILIAANSHTLSSGFGNKINIGGDRSGNDTHTVQIGDGTTAGTGSVSIGYGTNTINLSSDGSLSIAGTNILPVQQSLTPGTYNAGGVLFVVNEFGILTQIID